MPPDSNREAWPGTWAMVPLGDGAPGPCGPSAVPVCSPLPALPGGAHTARVLWARPPGVWLLEEVGCARGRVGGVGPRRAPGRRLVAGGAGAVTRDSGGLVP